MGLGGSDGDICSQGIGPFMQIAVGTRGTSGGHHLLSCDTPW